MDKELEKFLEWLEKEGIARWYYTDEEGVDNIVIRYLKDKS